MSSSRSIEALTRSSPEPGSSLLEARRESRGVDSRVLVVNSRGAQEFTIWSPTGMNRRELLKLGTAAAAAEFATLAMHGCGGGSFNTPPPGPASCSKLTDIEHVVILIQENRSFDHYFGSYRGVRGFSDKSAAFQQRDPANTTSTTNAACTHDITHAGTMGRWMVL